MRMFFLVLMFFSLSLTIQSREIVLTKDNTLVLNSAFTSRSVSQLIGEAIKMDAELKSGYPIYLFLNTPGGSIQAGLELIEFFKGINRPVHTITLFAASMGWQLVQHLGDRYTLEYGVLMSHKAYGGFVGEFGGGSSQIDSRYGLWLRRLRMMDRQTVTRTNGKKTLKQYQSEYDNELWLNGKEAVENGYADEVVSVKCGATLSGNRKKEITYNGYTMEFTFDNCPIRTGPVSIKSKLRTNQGYVYLEDFLNRGGMFNHKNCNLNNTKVVKDYYGNIVQPAKKADLCLLDKGLSFEKIQQSIEQEYKKNNVNNKKVIKMNFSNFISE